MSAANETRARVVAFVGLGSNLDDPCAQVRSAFEDLAELPYSSLIAQSSLWRSAPLGYTMQADFVNAVAQIETGLSPRALLAELQRIESAHARTRSFANAPRTLDLDLLLYGLEVHATPELSVPHPRMHERAFVLKPLLEIAPHLAIPGRGTATDCLTNLKTQTCERIA